MTENWRLFRIEHCTKETRIKCIYQTVGVYSSAFWLSNENLRVQLAVVTVIHNSARTWQKCIVVERRELLRDSRRHEKGATRIIGEYLPIERRMGKKERCREWDKRKRESFTRERERWARRERDWDGLRVLAKSSAIISAWYPLCTSARNEYART